MRYIQTLGTHIILVRVPVFNEVVMQFWVPEINTVTLRLAVSLAVKYMYARMSTLRNRRVRSASV